MQLRQPAVATSSTLRPEQPGAPVHSVFSREPLIGVHDRSVTLVMEAQTRQTDAATLYAACIDCGAHAHEWRRMLGRGARFFAAPGSADRLVVQYAHACGVCDSDVLVVAPK